MLRTAAVPAALIAMSLASRAAPAERADAPRAPAAVPVEAAPQQPSLAALLSRGLIVEEVSSKHGTATARVRFENHTGKRLQETVVRCFAIGPGGKEIGTEERAVSAGATLPPGFVGKLEVPVSLGAQELRLFSCKARTAVLD